MGANSAIEWTDHTMNPWWGCQRVSPGCERCYAETFDRRVHGKGKEHWGPTAERRFFGDKHWDEPLKWDREAARAGERRRVFCASMADVFEDRDELIPHRRRLFELIERTGHLDWLLLTKRPENIESMVPWCWGGAAPNVWFGATAENQEMANRRIPLLLEATSRLGAAVAFLSCEPLLGPIKLDLAMLDDRHLGWIDWVIVGGESGPGARPMHPDWARSIRDQCVDAGVAFFFKQWGDALPIDEPWSQENPSPLGKRERYLNLAGGHGFHGERVYRIRSVGKKAAGRDLDGRTWDELPSGVVNERKGEGDGC